MTRTDFVALSTTVMLALILGGCAFMGDPPPDPEVQPLEIVAGSSVQSDEPCILNVDEVRAGTHDVMVISESGRARVRILDHTGSAVLNVEVTPHPAKGGGFEVTEEDQGSVRLEAGDYRVTCDLAGKPTATTKLRVLAARPGYEESTGY